MVGLGPIDPAEHPHAGSSLRSSSVMSLWVWPGRERAALNNKARGRPGRNTPGRDHRAGQKVGADVRFRPLQACGRNLVVLRLDALSCEDSAEENGQSPACVLRRRSHGRAAPQPGQRRRPPGHRRGGPVHRDPDSERDESPRCSPPPGPPHLPPRTLPTRPMPRVERRGPRAAAGSDADQGRVTQAAASTASMWPRCSSVSFGAKSAASGGDGVAGRDRARSLTPGSARSAPPRRGHRSRPRVSRASGCPRPGGSDHPWWITVGEPSDTHPASGRYRRSRSPREPSGTARGRTERPSRRGSE